MEVYVVSYFYPDKSFAGIVGVTSSASLADDLILYHEVNGYGDCTFVTTPATVDDNATWRS